MVTVKVYKLTFSRFHMAEKTYDLKRIIKGVGVGASLGKIEYKLPFFRGTYPDSFARLNADSEVRPAENEELVYIFQEAFKAQTAGWKKVLNEVIKPSYLRNPKRLAYLPIKQSNVPFEPAFEGGVIVQRDVKGLGVSVPIPYRTVQGEWKEKDGIYINESAEMIFVPASKYKAGDHTPKSFVKDGLVRALLGGEESAERFREVAVDNKRVLRLWALNSKDISKEELRVADLCDGSGGGLGVAGDDIGVGGSCFAAWVFK